MSNSWRFAALHPSLSWRSAISPSSLRNAFSHSELCSQPCIYLNVSSCLSLFNPLMALLPLQPLCSILQLLRRKRSWWNVRSSALCRDLLRCYRRTFAGRIRGFSFLFVWRKHKTASVQAPRSQLHSFLANQIAVILDSAVSDRLHHLCELQQVERWLLSHYAEQNQNLDQQKDVERAKEGPLSLIPREWLTAGQSVKAKPDTRAVRYDQTLISRQTFLIPITI